MRGMTRVFTKKDATTLIEAVGLTRVATVEPYTDELRRCGYRAQTEVGWVTVVPETGAAAHFVVIEPGGQRHRVEAVYDIYVRQPDGAASYLATDAGSRDTLLADLVSEGHDPEDLAFEIAK